MVVDAQTSIRDFYELSYRPAHAEDKPATIAEYRAQINNLHRAVQFPWWCQRFDHPTRDWPPRERQAAFRWWLRHCGEPTEASWPRLRLADLSDTLLTQAMQFLVEGGRSLVTANKLRQHVNAIWNEAARQAIIPQRPFSRNYRTNRSAPKALMPDELARIYDACGRMPGMVGAIEARRWWPAAFMFVFSLGVRISAGFGVPARNLDLARGDVLVPALVQKQRHDQRLDLFPSATALLRDLRLVERGVPTVLGDWPFTINTFRDHYKVAIVMAKIGFDAVDEVPSDLLCHCLRRTLASMIYAKYGIEVARERLGHSSTEVTWRYIDPRYGGQPRIRDLLADPFASPAPPAGPPPLRIAAVG